MLPVLLRRAGAECLGTCVLVVIGDGAIIVNTATGLPTPLGVALLFGGCMVVLIALLGHRFGAHLNPAVTLLFALTRALLWRDVPLFLGGQLLGVICGAFILRVLSLHLLIPETTVLQSSSWIVLVLEIGFSLVLLLVVLLTAQTSASGTIGPVGLLPACLLGSTVTLGALLGSIFGGVLMNPALTLGLALVPSALHGQWVHVLGPLLAACTTASIYWGLRWCGRHDLPDDELFSLASQQPTPSPGVLSSQRYAWVVTADHSHILQATRRAFLAYDPRCSPSMTSKWSEYQSVFVAASATASGWFYLFCVKMRSSRIVIVMLFLRRT